MSIASVLIGGAIIGLLPAWLAQRKGHSFFTWWIFGALLFIVAIVLVFFLKDKRPKCPECKEVVQPDANRCPHCQAEIAGRIVQYVTPTA